MTHQGFLLAVEGGDGAGKSTQIALLERRLRAHGLPVTRTKEPGGTPIGAALRALLLDPANTDLSPEAEALLYAADRAQHAATLIRPALAAGHIVLTDRYLDSSAVYQGHARGMGLHKVRELSVWATRGLLPDLTILLDIDPVEGLRRASTAEFGQADRIEDAGLDFHRAVRAGFLQLAAEDPDRYVVVDAAAPASAVAEAVWAAVAARLPAAAAVAHPPD